MSYFLSEVPGVNQARVAEDLEGWIAPDGDAVFVLGDMKPGFTRRFVPGDSLAVSQTLSGPVAAEKLVRFRARIRGPRSAPPMVTALLEPYTLANGQTITLEIDEGAPQVITFQTADFVDIANARAREVRDVINAQLAGARAGLNGVGGVEIRSLKQGRRARVFLQTGTAPLGLQEWAWFASIRIDGTEHGRVEIRPGETRDLSDVAASLSSGGTPEVSFVLELGTK